MCFAPAYSFSFCWLGVIEFVKQVAVRESDKRSSLEADITGKIGEFLGIQVVNAAEKLSRPLSA